MSIMANLTQIESIAVEKLRNLIADCLPEDEFFSHDLHLVRWLRARNLDLEKAEAMFRKSVEWRDNNDIRSILNWTFPQIMIDELPWKCPGFDKTGCPVIAIYFGKWNIRKVVELGYRKQFLRGSYFCSEWELALMKHKSSKDNVITQAVQIIDLEGYSLAQFASKQTIEAFLEQVRQMEDNYPEILKAVYLVNAPRVFTLLFRLIKPLLSAETLAKVNIFGSNDTEWKSALLKLISPDHLPSEFGGSNISCPLFSENVLPSQIGPDFLEFDEKEFVTVSLENGKTHQLHFEITEENTVLNWVFKTNNSAVGFCLTFNGDLEVIKVPRRVDSHVHLQKGRWVCRQPGKYTMCFSNDKLAAQNLSYCARQTARPEGKEP